MNTEPTLKIEIPEHYQIVYETSEDFEKSPFASSYNKAKQLVEEIVNKQEEIIQKSQCNQSNISLNSYNNIIAFTGERGMGKSSTMISFLNSLSGKHSTEVSTPKLGLVQFITLDIVDPSLFRGNESIFEIVLAQMFQKFKDVMEQQTKRNNDEERRKLILHFQKVYDTFRVTKKDNKEIYNEESIDNLINLAKGSNLRTSFDTLVQSFLTFTGGNRNNKLVVTIDDFDLKINGVKEMLEDIRQLLINNNILILIAYKDDQLRDIIKRSFSKEMEGISDKNTPVILEVIEKQTDKYLEKLLPNNHTITLLSNDQREIKNYLNKYISGYVKRDTNNKTLHKVADEILLELVYSYKKLFIKSSSNSSSVLYHPNLRTINELLISIEDNSFDSFVNLLRTTYTKSKDNDIVFKMWYCEPILINALTLEYCLNTFERFIPEDNKVTGKAEPQVLNLRKAYRELLETNDFMTIQFGDISALFYLLDNKISLLNNEYILFQSIKMMYNLRRLELVNENPNYIRKSSLSGLINTTLLPDSYRMSREASSNRYRDSFTAKFSNVISIAEIDKIKSYTSHLGENSTTTKDNAFEYYKEPTPNYHYYHFNLFNHKFLFDIDIKEDHLPQLTIEYRLSQNTDFVIELYEMMLKNYAKTFKNQTIKSLTYLDLLSKLKVNIFSSINKNWIEKYPYISLNLSTDSNQLYNDFLVDTYNNQISTKKINRVEDITFTHDDKEIVPIINALYENKEITTLKNLFNQIQKDNNLKEFLLSDKFIASISSSSDSQYQKNRKNLLNKLSQIVETEKQPFDSLSSEPLENIENLPTSSTSDTIDDTEQLPPSSSSDTTNSIENQSVKKDTVSSLESQNTGQVTESSQECIDELKQQEKKSNSEKKDSNDLTS